jgi:hypothetical protein
VQRLQRLPRPVVPIVVFVLLIYGLLGQPVWLAVICLVVLIGFLIWLTTLSWARTPTRGRFVREVLILLIIFAAISRVVGWS